MSTAPHSVRPNTVWLQGKISRVGVLKYTPSGTAICDFTLAVPQRFLDKDSMGYFEAVVLGESAEAKKGQLRIGKRISLTGSLWARSFRNRQGLKVSETKVLVETIEGE